MIKNTSFALKKWIFGVVTFIATFTTEMAFISATAEFLNQGLIDWLPTVMLLVSVFLIVNYSLASLFSRRFSALGSMNFFVFSLMIMTAGCLYFRQYTVACLFFTLLLANYSSTAFDIALENLSDHYVNSRQAKTFLPLMNGVMDVAQLLSSVAIIGVSVMRLTVDPLWLILVGTALTCLGVAVINRLFDPVVDDQEEQRTGLALGMKQSLSFVFRQNRLFKLMAWLFMFFGGISILTFYVYSSSFSANLSGENLTNFLAVVSFVAVLIRGIFNLGLLQKLIYKIGVANMLLLYPWAMFILSFLTLFLFRNLYVAAALFVFYTLSFFSYVTVATQSMLGMVPKQLSQQVYFFIKGVIISLAALVTSFLVTLIMPFFNNDPRIASFMLILLTAGSLIAALKIKNAYQFTLLRVLDEDDQYLRNNSVQLMGESVQKEKGEKLLRKIVVNQKESLEIRQHALTSLVEINNPNSIREFLLILENDKNLRIRYYAIQAINKVFEKMNKKRFGNMNVTKLLMIDVFNKVYDENLPLPIKLEVNQALKMFGFDVLLDFYKRHFTSSTDFIKASIIEALAVADDRGLITLLEPYLHNHNLTIKAAAITGLWRFEEMRDRLMSIMIDIFSQKDNVHRMASLKLIGELKLKKMEDYVLDLVAVPDKELSTMAIITSINLGRLGGVKVLSRKLVKFAMMGDSEMVEFIFKKFYSLSPKAQKKLLVEIKSLSSENFNHLKGLFSSSDAFFDLTLVTLFTS